LSYYLNHIGGLNLEHFSESGKQAINYATPGSAKPYRSGPDTVTFVL